MRESRLHGFGRGAVSNDRPYRASMRVFRILTHKRHRPASHVAVAKPVSAPMLPVSTRSIHSSRHSKDLRAVESNARWSMRKFRETPEGRALMAEGRIKVVGAVCEIGTGRVRLLA